MWSFYGIWLLIWMLQCLVSYFLKTAEHLYYHFPLLLYNISKPVRVDEQKRWISGCVLIVCVRQNIYIWPGYDKWASWTTQSAHTCNLNIKEFLCILIKLNGKKNCSFPSICIIQAVIHFHHQNIYINLFIHYQLKGRTLQKMGQFVIVFHYAPILWYDIHKLKMCLKIKIM